MLYDFSMLSGGYFTDRSFLIDEDSKGCQGYMDPNFDNHGISHLYRLPFYFYFFCFVKVLPYRHTANNPSDHLLIALIPNFFQNRQMV